MPLEALFATLKFTARRPAPNPSAERYMEIAMHETAVTQAGAAQDHLATMNASSSHIVAMFNEAKQIASLSHLGAMTDISSLRAVHAATSRNGKDRVTATLLGGTSHPTSFLRSHEIFTLLKSLPKTEAEDLRHKVLLAITHATIDAKTGAIGQYCIVSGQVTLNDFSPVSVGLTGTWQRAKQHALNSKSKPTNLVLIYDGIRPSMLTRFNQAMKQKLAALTA